jgi:hypothetical protein
MCLRLQREIHSGSVLLDETLGLVFSVRQDQDRRFLEACNSLAYSIVQSERFADYTTQIVGLARLMIIKPGTRLHIKSQIIGCFSPYFSFFTLWGYLYKVRTGNIKQYQVSPLPPPQIQDTRLLKSSVPLSA